MFNFPKQLSLADVSDCFDALAASTPKTLLDLLSQHFDISTFIPQQWYTDYISWNGRPHQYSLESMLSALLLQRFLSIPTTKLLVSFLSLSETAASFRGFFASIPDESTFCRFKLKYVDRLKNFFDNLVDKAQSICLELDPDLARTLLIDTTGFEAYVKENNPKFFNSILHKLKASNPSLTDAQLHAMAANSMPKAASCDESIRLQYVNGHFAYAHKAVIITNGLGIPLYLDIPDNSVINDAQNAIPESTVPPHETAEPSSDTAPSDDVVSYKAITDSKMLIPACQSLLERHPSFVFDYVIGDSGFDITQNYQFIVKNMNAFPVIPLNPRNSDPNLLPAGTSDLGKPTCPRNPNLVMRYAGTCKGQNRSLRIKYECPLLKRSANGPVLCCQNPCTNSKWGRMVYLYPKDNYRVNTPIPRDSELWDFIYDRRLPIEQTISRFKLPILPYLFHLK